MSSRHHIDDFMRGLIIGKIEEGRKITDVAREFDIAHSVVSRLWKSFKTTGMCSRRHGGGRVRSTTPAEDRYIVLSAKRNRLTIAQQVANQFLAASGKQISRKTVARRLRGGGLYARRPVVCVPLTMTDQRYIMKFYFLMFVFSVVLSVINLFLWTTTQHVIEHSLFRIV
ncbi:transposable element Tcb1 transposase [Trichonephila clavipes]|nr:transposable element Tcb1 transposase [Trichonephila clavipes]